MNELTVVIDTITKVKEFCELCSKCSEDVTVHSNRYIVSGKSIMGLFSLDLGKPVNVKFYENVPCEVEEGMKKFIVD